MLISWIILLISLVVLVKSADVLVDGASSFAARLGISSLIVGLTIVAFGTSAPELSVNISSAFGGVTDIAVGNILGSNIANILLVLGLVAWMKGIKLQKSTVWKEIPFMTFASVMLFVMAMDTFMNGAAANVVSAGDGIILLSVFALFLYSMYVATKTTNEHRSIPTYPLPKTLIMILGGLTGLIVSGQFLVEAATDIARIMGATERFIGLTVIAIGTSLPELITSIVAAKKGKPDLAVGNVVGSNIFNILFVLGVTSLVAPLPISPSMFWDALFVVVCSITLFLFLFIGKRHAIDRWQGAIFTITYVTYIGTLIALG